MDTGKLTGLLEAEAAERLRLGGFNELPAQKRQTLHGLVLALVREPMLLLLVAAGSVYVALGDHVEAALLFASIFVVIGIELYQHVRTERALEALKDLSSPRALVIRDGAPRRIPGREVVVDDLVVLAEGDRVPADGVILQSTNLVVDESLLTGESMPVSKDAVDRCGESSRSGDTDRSQVYSGALVTAGQGIARVIATGQQTQIGKIGRSLETMEVQRTALQREISRAVQIVGRLALLVCGLVVVGYGAAQADWVQGILAGISVAMSLIPEEFPIVLTAFLALGAARIAKNQVLTRRIAAIEALGATTVLCTDKTGTLTLNRMAITRVWADDLDLEIDAHPEVMPESVQAVVRTGALASRPTPVDPMDRAIRSVTSDRLPEVDRSINTGALVREYSLTSRQPVMTNVWRLDGQDDLFVAAKGAPEAIAELCRLDEQQRRALDDRVASLAREGVRVLGVAQSRWPRDRALPEWVPELRLRLVGLLGFTDPVRPDVPRAIQECYAAGIRVIMITGDHVHTARAVARQVGLRDPDTVLTGAEVEALDDQTLRARLLSANVFVRVVPEQKLRIVEALEAAGEVVAMTGDGVNDAPALKAAHIGVAMGGRGTDVAREAAPLVLLDDDFSSIVRAIRAGRRIYDNLRKSMTFLLAIHVPIAGLSLVPALAGWPLILLPAHIVLLEFIVDPVCSLAFEQEPDEHDVMQRPPRDPRVPLFTRHLIGHAMAQGTVVLVVTLALYVLAPAGAEDAGYARAVTFATLVIAFLGLILSNRSFSQPIVRSIATPNKMLWWMLGGVPVALAVVLSVPAAREVFRFSKVDGPAVIQVLLAGLLIWIALEVVEVAARFIGRDSG